MTWPRGRTPLTLLGVLVTAAAAGLLLLESRPDAAQAPASSTAPQLVPTAHPPLPLALSAFWIAAPAAAPAATPAVREFVRGAQLLDETGDAAAALPLVSAGALAATPVADYARYYTGMALWRLNRLDEADAAFAALVAKRPDGHLAEDAALAAGQVREARNDYRGAAALYEDQASRPLAQPQVVALRLGAAAEQLGDRARAVAAYRRVYDEWPLTVEAGQAEQALTRLSAWDADWPARAERERARAATLFTARRFAPARASYTRIREASTGAARDQAEVRLAAIDVLTGNGRRARATLASHRGDPGDTGLEARFYYLGATRAAGQHDAFEAASRAFVDGEPGSVWAEEALNNLATHYILVDDDDKAEAIFTDMLARFPTGRHAERAAWRAGWWAYRAARYRDAIRLFELGCANFPRSDYRPAWLYWSARAYDLVNDADNATARYRLTASDYLNSYYGRLAAARLRERGVTAVPSSIKRVATTDDPSLMPPTTPRIELLIALGLNREALNELRYAQRVWGDNPRLQATVALVQNRLGELRLGINAMKRAYPQFMAAGGEDLPPEILRVLFPVSYWPALQKYAAARSIDPYLLAALVAQESTFDPVIRSSANAIGLMQIIPATGRRYAARLGIRPFSAARLTDPDVNLRIGTSYFADLIAEFGGAHYALASYNAGENRVRAWKAERGPLEQEVFIDDIPFPETQNYVKRILGTAEDYRSLYGGVRGPATTPSTEPPVRPAAAKPAGSPASSGTASPAKPAAKAPAARKPAAKKPTTRKPAAKKPAKKPAVKKPTPKKPAQPSRTTSPRP